MEQAPPSSDAVRTRLLAEAGLELTRDEGGLALSDGTMEVRGDFARLLPRLKQGALARELVVRAAKVKGEAHPTAIDATAGLGDDSFLLAAAGFTVLLCERNPVIAALLADALARAAAHPRLAAAAARMALLEVDSVDLLNAIAESMRTAQAEGDLGPERLQRIPTRCATMPEAIELATHALAGEQPDVVLLDPMFPEKRKAAQAKKKLQLLQRLEQPCDDEAALLAAARAACPRKIVVKRPIHGPHLAGHKPDYTLGGKAVRYDCIICPRNLRA